MIFFKTDAKLLGVKFFSSENKVLLSTGMNYIESTVARGDSKTYELK
jgi:hypothetical protein